MSRKYFFSSRCDKEGFAEDVLQRSVDTAPFIHEATSDTATQYREYLSNYGMSSNIFSLWKCFSTSPIFRKYKI
jgi:hypothetical protein